jgi:hypothetical protein
MFSDGCLYRNRIKKMKKQSEGLNELSHHACGVVQQFENVDATSGTG